MRAKSKRKERLTPEQLDANYANLMEGKELVNNRKDLFDGVIKKAAAPKQINKSKNGGGLSLAFFFL